MLCLLRRITILFNLEVSNIDVIRHELTRPHPRNKGVNKYDVRTLIQYDERKLQDLL